MKTVLRDRTSNVPDGIDPKIQRWMQIQNSDNSRDHQDLEDEFGKIGAVRYWTPDISFTIPGDLTVGYGGGGVQLGDLIRTKDEVIATFVLAPSVFTWTTSGGSLVITGLPYTASTRSGDSGFVWTGDLLFQGITKANYTQFTPAIVAGDNKIAIIASGSGKSAVNVAPTDMPSGGSVLLKGSIHFRIRS